MKTGEESTMSTSTKSADSGGEAAAAAAASGSQAPHFGVQTKLQVRASTHTDAAAVKELIILLYIITNCV